MLNFDMFKFVALQGPYERKRRRSNPIFQEIVEKFRPHIKSYNIISGKIYFIRDDSGADMKAFDHCYGVEPDEHGFINTTGMDDLDYTWSLGQSVLRIDNVEPWLEKNN